MAIKFEPSSALKEETKRLSPCAYADAVHLLQGKCTPWLLELDSRRVYHILSKYISLAETKQMFISVKDSRPGSSLPWHFC